MIYILSVSFQIAGSILLMIHSFSVKRKDIIKRFAGNGIIIQDDDKNTVNYNKKAFKNTYRDAYYIKFSFFYLVLGYILDIFRMEVVLERKYLIICVAFFTILIILIARLIIKILLKYNKSINKEISIEELKSSNIKPDFGITSTEDIDKLFKK